MIFGLYHSPGETVGLIGEVLKKLSLPFRDVHLYAGDGLPRNTSDLEGMIVMGGCMNVDDVREYPFLLEEISLIEKVIADGKPVLGICLGSQLIAKALGARVYANHKKELGWHPIKLTAEAKKDPFFKDSPEELVVMQWHGDTFDLPAGAVHLAYSAHCQNQAFRWGNSTYGFQFHIEVTPGMIQSWCTSDDAEQYILSAGEKVSHVLRKTPSAFARLEPVAQRLFQNYFKSSFAKLASVA